jgi:hypothetical protein
MLGPSVPKISRPGFIRPVPKVAEGDPQATIGNSRKSEIIRENR